MNNAANGTAPRIAIRAEGVWKSYDDGAITVLKGVDFEAHAGQAIALCGLLGMRQEHPAASGGRT